MPQELIDSGDLLLGRAVVSLEQLAERTSSIVRE